MEITGDNRVLIVGVYLLGTANNAVEISRVLRRSLRWRVDLRWAAVGAGEPPPALKELTVLTTSERIPKFHLINELIRGAAVERCRYLMVTDDDIEVADGFVDAYLRLQERYDFALAQPARTHDSYIDHYFVAKLEGVDARRTRFVEIGPLFSLRRDVFDLMLPFDPDAPMGWGLDFVWPRRLEADGFHLGIVDAAPVRHALRKPVAHYDYNATNDGMSAFLSRRDHLTRSEAFVALESFPLIEGPVIKGRAAGKGTDEPS